MSNGFVNPFLQAVPENPNQRRDTNPEECIIRSLLKPTIQVDDMIVEDAFQGTSENMGDQKGVESGYQVQNTLGTTYPFIMINAVAFNTGDIYDFEIDSTEFIPTLRLEIILDGTNTGFKFTSVPKDGDLVNVFVRAKADAFKPIRNDFLITRVDISPGVSQGQGGTLTILGELFIPHIHDEVLKSYSGTTFEVLQNVAKDLGLGFATNETFTDDSQRWLCAGDSLYNFINHVAGHAWKNEQSFYKVFIDNYYHLNFVNVNPQVAGDGRIEVALLDASQFRDVYNDKDQMSESSQKTTAKMLTDISSLKDTNMFIKQYGIENNSSFISKKWGYKSFSQFFDYQSLQFWNIFVDPLITEGAADKKILLKGRSFKKYPDGKSVETYWQTQNKRYWQGVQYEDVHDKYYYAELWNTRNNEELEKMYMIAHVERWNPNIYRGEKIPVLVYSQSNVNARRQNTTPEEVSDTIDSGSEANMTANQIYSGFYMVDGMKITYSMVPGTTNFTANAPTNNVPSYTEIFYLKRREWPVPGTG
jgi:hypothetical protein